LKSIPDDCQYLLERPDFDSASRVKTEHDFRAALDKLESECTDGKLPTAFRGVRITLRYYEIFMDFLDEIIEHVVDTSLLRGLLFLVIQV
jgi:hypothetical protein